MNELKPCPFCKNKKIKICKYSEDKIMYAAYCDYSEGGCGAEAGKRYTIESAKEAWNRRADSD